MRMKWMVLSLAILAVALIPAAYADCGCENAEAEETAVVEAKSCGGHAEGQAANAGRRVPSHDQTDGQRDC